MNSLIPQKNITYAYIAGAITALLVHVLSKMGYSVSPDISDALTGLGAVLVGHFVDILADEGKKANDGQNSGLSGKTPPAP